MRLKQLEIEGFKSFPHRTVIEFARGLTAIVGPNGCGKSNVVDAIRWVLGEQSARLLRGAQMEDVLFKGSDQLPPSNMAEVSLTLELGGPSERLEALDENSIAAQILRECGEAKVTRRLYRSGESEYLLNGRACRLRDVTDMFLGSGVGARSYAVIEQGKVDQLIVAKPEDRRSWIEEAAGTTLFRVRKIAAERKMERTKENLQRLNDILRELERQLNYMRRLAKRAEQARAAEDEIRRIELILAVRERARLEEWIAEKESAVRAIVVAAEGIRERLDRAELELEVSRSHERDALVQLSSLRERRVQLEAELEGLRGQIALARRQQEERSNRKRAIESELSSIRAQVRESAEIRTREAEKRSQIAREIFVLEHKRGVAARTRELLGARLTAYKMELERIRTQDLELRQERSELENEDRRLRKESAELATRKDFYDKELQAASARLREVEQELLRCKRQWQVAQDQRCRLLQRQEEKRQRAEALARELRDRQQENEELADECLRLQSRLDTLEELRRRYAGFNPSVQKLLLGENGSRWARAVVAEILDVPAALERAVAAALGDLLQCVIVNQEEESLAAVSRLREAGLGRGWFVALTGTSRNGKKLCGIEGNIQPLADLVGSEQPYREVVGRLLADVALVPRLEDALAYHRRLQSECLLVTPAGESVDRHGVVSGGAGGANPGEELLARRRLVQELAQSLRLKNAELREKREAYEQLARGLEAERQELLGVEAALQRLSVQIVGWQKDIDRWKEERRRLVDQVEHGSLERVRLVARSLEVGARIAAVSERLKVLATIGSEAQPLAELLEGQSVQAEQRCVQLDRQIRGWELDLARARERHEALVQTLVRLEQQEVALRQRMKSLIEALAASSVEHDKTASAIAELEFRQARLQRQVESLAQEERARDDNIAQAAARRELAERTVHEMSMELDSCREGRARAEVELVETRSQLEHLRQTVLERYRCKLEDVVVEDCPETEEDLRRRLEALRSTLERVGGVGSSVVEELRETEERAQFLRTQKADLERALKDVENTIERLDGVSRGKFLEAFEAIQSQFAAVMPRLFGGGEGRLVLAEPANLSTSGVDIIVRPPGKRLETVALLSGGEKALAAVALIFSLFAWRPSPFCILDEVDAALDDANVVRFMELVRAMTSSSQFIVITHNKRTMQVADRLYGVTMQQPGVSTLLAVELH
ncbi:MAG: chromosome segregation protein SMC [Candidatus Binatia bacterium]|nr:chromosome segregation protein SMC [Candidatus Binatia bacterium]